MLVSCLCQSILNGLCSSSFGTEIRYVRLIFPTSVACPVQRIYFDRFTVMLRGSARKYNIQCIYFVFFVLKLCNDNSGLILLLYRYFSHTLLPKLTNLSYRGTIFLLLAYLIPV